MDQTLIVPRITMRICEQVDKTGEKLTYSWLLDGAYVYRKHLKAWKWVPGLRCAGCFVTNDENLAKETANKFKLNVISNGTHNCHNAPSKLF